MQNTLDTYNPSTEELLEKIECSTEQEIQKTVSKAYEAKEFWGNEDMKHRIEALGGIYEEIKQKKDKLSKDIAKEVGLPINQCEFEIDGALEILEWYMQNAEEILKPKIIEEDDQILKVKHMPKGITAVFSPWNYPLSDFMGRVVPNLVAGNPVVVKASPECSLFMKKIEVIFKKHLGDNGVFNIVYGAAKEGEALVDQNIDFICFSGSPEVGDIMQKKAGEKGIPIISELGGSARSIVLDGANTDTVIQSVEDNRLSYNGEICDGMTVMLIQKDMFEKLKKLLIEMFQNINMGNALDEKVDLGPLSSKKQVKMIDDIVKESEQKGADILVGGKKPKDMEGYFYPATLIEIQKEKVKNLMNEMRAFYGDVFGPVLTIVPFDTVEEAIKMFNNTEFGLGGYLFTKEDDKNIEKALEEIEPELQTSMLSINNICYVGPNKPFGGIKKSGMGRIGGVEALKNHCETKIITYSNKMTP